MPKANLDEYTTKPTILPGIGDKEKHFGNLIITLLFLSLKGRTLMQQNQLSHWMMATKAQKLMTKLKHYHGNNANFILKK